MATTTIVAKRGSSQIDTVVLDASITEQHRFANQITEHPVEEGAAISDHARPLPDGLTMEFVITNTPIGARASRSVERWGVRFTSHTEQDAPIGAPGPAADALTKLLAIRNEGRLVTVYTTLRTYESMAIESLDVPRDRTTGEALRGTATFKRVRVVKNKLTRVVVARDPRAGQKVKTGKQATPAATEDASGLYTLSTGLSESGNNTLSKVGTFLLGGGR